MVERERRQILRVGFLAFASLAILAGSVFLIGEQVRFWEKRSEYRIHFARTNGLLQGAPVSLSGVTVGSVSGMAFPENIHENYVVVTIAVTGTAAGRIREDTLASIRALGLLGDKFVELSRGNPEAPSLPPGAVIAAVDPVDYEAILGQSGDVVSNVMEVTSALKRVLIALEAGEGLLGMLLTNREAGSQTLGNLQATATHVENVASSLQRVMARVEKGDGVIGTLLKDPRSGEEILGRLRRASHHLENTLRSLDHSSSALERFSTELDSSSGLLPVLIRDETYATTLLSELQTTAKNLADITAKMNRGDGTLGALLNDAALYNEVTELVKGANDSSLYAFYRGFKNLWPFKGSKRGRGQPKASEARQGLQPGPGRRDGP